MIVKADTELNQAHAWWPYISRMEQCFSEINMAYATPDFLQTPDAQAAWDPGVRMRRRLEGSASLIAWVPSKQATESCGDLDGVSRARWGRDERDRGAFSFT